MWLSKETQGEGQVATDWRSGRTRPAVSAIAFRYRRLLRRPLAARPPLATRPPLAAHPPLAARPPLAR